MIDTLLPLIKKFLPFAQKRIGFNKPPRLFLKNDSSNAGDPLGKTAYYDPNKKSVTIYVTGRHPKDVMRSLSHELVHHKQNCRGDFDSVGEMGEGYAQNDEHLREMEREAYETGNMCFRDWEDSLKNTIYYEHLQKGENKMSLKDWKNNEVKSLLSEAWGFKMDLGKLNEGDDESKGDDDDIGTNPWGGKYSKKKNPWGTKKDGSPEHHMGTGEGDDELEEGCGDDEDADTVIEDGTDHEVEDEHYKDNSMHDEDHIKAIEHHLDALKRDKEHDDDHIDERSSLEDAHPQGSGRRITKPNGERVTSEAKAKTAALQKAILEALRKHF
jgi:hypothetical protein